MQISSNSSKYSGGGTEYMDAFGVSNKNNNLTKYNLKIIMPKVITKS